MKSSSILMTEDYASVDVARGAMPKDETFEERSVRRVVWISDFTESEVSPQGCPSKRRMNRVRKRVFMYFYTLSIFSGLL